MKPLHVSLGGRGSSLWDEALGAVCWFAGVHYDGVQETSRGRWLVITEPTTQSTGHVAIDERFTTSAVLAKAQEIRRRYGH